MTDFSPWLIALAIGAYFAAWRVLFGPRIAVSELSVMAWVFSLFPIALLGTEAGIDQTLILPIWLLATFELCFRNGCYLDYDIDAHDGPPFLYPVFNLIFKEPDTSDDTSREDIIRLIVRYSIITIPAGVVVSLITSDVIFAALSVVAAVFVVGVYWSLWHPLAGVVDRIAEATGVEGDRVIILVGKIAHGFSIGAALGASMAIFSGAGG